MLPKENRLSKKNDFDAVFKDGKGVRTAIISVKSIKNSLSHNRFGFVVSKKISTKATVRNKVKRRLRDIVSKVTLLAGVGQDVVIVAMPGIEKKEFSEVKTATESVLVKLNIL